jgi:hypothetical protein
MSLIALVDNCTPMKWVNDEALKKLPSTDEELRCRWTLAEKSAFQLFMSNNPEINSMRAQFSKLLNPRTVLHSSLTPCYTRSMMVGNVITSRGTIYN